jgi:soluble lytic murein transglycosylase
MACSAILHADISKSFFDDKPRSHVKDFYISRYLDQNISAEDAKSLIGEVDNMNWRLFHKFAKKVDDFSFRRVSYCKKLPASAYVGKDNDCIKIGLTPYKATKLPPEKLIDIALQIRYAYPDDALLYVMIAKHNFDDAVKDDPDLFLRLFNTTGSTFRRRYLDHPIPPKRVEKLSKLKAFNTTIEKIVRDPQMKTIRKSILKFDSSALNAQSNFLLGLNALELGHEEIAIWYFKLSQKKAWFDFDKDRALFWQYLVTQDPKILEELRAPKHDINIYSLFAHEKGGTFPKNIVTGIDPKQPKAPFDITDPFAWLKIYNGFKQRDFKSHDEKIAAALKLNAKESEPHVARLIYRYKDRLHYYLLAYYDYIKTLPPKRQALILALARQESRFIPTEVSYSYALGLMQFMPFLAKAIAKEQHIKHFQLEEMFDPATAYRFADIHLDFLQKHLFHPLLVAYAYNAGIGYTKREIIQKERYFSDGKYEPFMSMELLANAQARKYGKKVLANYVVYAKILGIKDVRLLTLLKNLRSKHRISDFQTASSTSRKRFLEK